MRTLILYGAVTTTADAVANLLVPKTGRIKSIRWVVGFDGPADNARANLELSVRSTSQFATNDVSQVIDAYDIVQNITTSGGGAPNYKAQSMVDFPVAAGERIYLHASVTGTVAAPTRIFIDIMD